MPQFSKTSKQRLETCHQDIITICHYAIQILDFSVIRGFATAEEQFELFKKGRTRVGDWWTITGDVVTYKDGYIKKSRHQSGEAIDLVPYPGLWDAPEKRFFELAGVIKATAFLLKKYGDIEHGVEWGFDLWNWDLAHFQLR